MVVTSLPGRRSTVTKGFIMPRKSRTLAATADEPTHVGSAVDQVIEQAATTAPDVFDEAIAARKAEQQNQTLQEAMAQQAAPPVAATTDQPAEPQGDGQKKWVDRGPVGRHTIDLGDDRKMKFSRWDKFQHSRIEFVGKDESVDVRPSPEDTAFMKQNG